MKKINIPILNDLNQLKRYLLWWVLSTKKYNLNMISRSTYFGAINCVL